MSEADSPPAARRASRPTVGRPRKLTQEKIIAAALAVVDEQGFEALSTRSLARQLGTTGSTLYNYVDCIEDVETEVVRTLTATMPLPTATTGPALRIELLEHLQFVRRLIVRHPHVVLPVIGSKTWNLLSEINARWYAALAPFAPQPHVAVLAHTALIGTVNAYAARENLHGPIRTVRRHKCTEPFLQDVKLASVEDVMTHLVDLLLPGLSRPRADLASPP